MPVPASEAVASDVGHGALGVRFGLRPWRDLLSETVGQRHLWVELRPKKVLATWVLEGGGPQYSKAVAETHDGVVLDVVGVRTLTETLTRVESITLTTVGKFFYDGATLYIHLTGGANPSGTTVVAELGVHVGSHGVYQPVLGPDRLVNGTFEEWTGATPDGWTVSGAPGTVDKTTADPLQGSYAARVTFAAETGAKYFWQTFTTLAAGAVYRYSGAYRVTGAGLLVKIFVFLPWTEFLSSDGRTIKASGPVFQESAAPDGEWRRFAFDFVCPSWATTTIRIDAVAASATGTVDFDDLKLQLVSRYAYHEPLLSLQSLPTIEAARADSFWGEMSSAIGLLSMLNGNGYWEALLASYDWVGADVVVRVGGRYQLDGNEVLMDDCPIIALAKLGAPSVSDDRVTFELEDDRKLLQRTLPTRTYNNNGGTDAYTQPDRGRVRPLLFGQKDGIRPVQYDITTPYAGAPIPQGIYELVDCTDWADGIKNFIFFKWYSDDQAASARSTVRRNQVDGLTDYSNGITRAETTGRFTMLRDQRPIIITQENNKLHFDIGGAQLTATLPVGTYTMYDDRNISGVVGLLRDLKDLMNTAAGTGDIAGTFVDTAQKVRISKGAGTLNLLCATGSDVQNGIWELLGFDAIADKTGSLSYDADEVFTFQAFDQTIRLDAKGFKDDSSGTYTGTANASIELAPDIAHFLLRVILGQPASTIDTASFVAARSVATRPCSLYIGAPRTVADVFQELETTGDMDLVLSGGVWFCLTRDTSVPAGTPDLEDSDFLAFEAGYEPEDLFGTVLLTYAQSPDNPEPIKGGNFPWSPGRNTEMGEATDDDVALRYGRPHQRRFDTCLASESDATTDPARLQEIATEAQTKRRRFRFSTKGKALQVPVNGKIRLTRARGLDSTGALDAVLVRVLSKRDDWARWVSDIVAIEVI